MVRTGSESGYESVVAGQIEEILSPIRVEREAVDDLGFNVIAEHRGKEGAPTIILNGHMDTVGIAEGWTREPLSADIEDGRLYGLGSADMKGGLAALIWAFKMAVKEGSPLNIVFTAVVREELDSEGAFELLKHRTGDLALIAEPTGERLMLGARGRYAADITFTGKAAHGARPSMGVNAIECAAKYVERLREIKPASHPDMGQGSICALKIEGGSDFLSVPDRCTITVDRHVVPGESRDDVMRDFLSIAGDECRTEIMWHPRKTPFLEPYEYSADDGLIGEFSSLYRERYDAPPIYGESVGDFNAFGKRMPTVVYGPKGENWHSADEYVIVDSVERVARLYYDFLKLKGESYERENA